MDFFGGKAKKGLDFIKSRAKETVEAQKVVSQIRQLEEQRDRCLMDIGLRVIAMFENDVLDRFALKDRVDEAQSLMKELEIQQQAYQKLKEQLKHSVEEILPKSEQEFES